MARRLVLLALIALAGAGLWMLLREPREKPANSDALGAGARERGRAPSDLTHRGTDEVAAPAQGSDGAPPGLAGRGTENHAEPTEPRPADWKGKEDLRFVVALEGTVPEKVGPVLLNVLRDGETKPRSFVLWQNMRRGREIGELRLDPDEAEASPGRWPLILSGLPRGDYTLFARTARHRRYSRPLRVRLPLAEAPLEIPLLEDDEHGTLDIVVERGKHRLPSYWVQIKAGAFFVAMQGGHLGRPPRVRSMRVPPDTDLTVSLVTHEGMEERGTTGPRQVRVGPGRRAPVKFVLPAGTPVRIRTTRPSGADAPTKLTLWRLDAKSPVWLDADEAGLGSGNRQGHLKPGRYHVLATPRRGFETGVPATATFAVPETGEVDVDLPLREADRNLTLQVRDEHGIASKRRRNFVLWRDAESLEDVRVVEGGIGHVPVRLPAVPPGTYDLVVFGWGHRRVEVYETHEQALEVILPALESRSGTAQVRGTIRRAEGGPRVRNCMVFLTKEGGEDARATRSHVSLAVGAYDFDDLPAGTYTLRIPSSHLHAPPHAEVVRQVEVLEKRDVTLNLTLLPR